MDAIKELTRYKQWADDLLLGTMSQLPANELTASRPIIFGSMLRTLNHVHAMDHVWRCHLEGRPHGLDASALQEVVELTFIGGGEGSMSRGEILLHVVNHATYHRGHIADMMYGTSTPPPTTDLPVYLRSRAAVPDRTGRS